MDSADIMNMLIFLTVIASVYLSEAKGE